jgi:hypothetical protein
MDMEKIKEISVRVFNGFDDITNLCSRIPEADSNGCCLLPFLNEIVPVPEDKIPNDLYDFFYDYRIDLIENAFTLGYVLGLMIESSYPSIQKDVEVFKGILREKAVLPYLPRL